MAHFVKVEFSIKDVKRPSPPKRRSQRPPKQSPQKKVVTIKDGFTELVDHARQENRPGPEAVVEEPHHPPLLTHDGRLTTASPPRKNIHINHHVKTIHRINPADKLPRQRTLQPEMYFSIKPPDRDILLTEQDLLISSFRLQHPSIYEDLQVSARLPELKREDCHHLAGVGRLIPRDRTQPKTTGTILNDSLPFHPKLKADLDHGIHPQRWNVMTIQQDDVDRLLPMTTRPSTRHEDFERVFKGKNNVREEPRVVKLREEELM